ncbi:MAG: MFS transporter [Solirubrobacterales bacterium]|nr:MFS transporter [Solirubrobacterales bacterium]
MLSAAPVEGLPEITPGADLAELIVSARGPEPPLTDTSVVVIAHKVVSKSEGRTRSLAEVEPRDRARELAARLGKDPRHVQVVLDESLEVLRAQRGVLICVTRHGFVCANAGVDASNVPDPDHVVLLPLDPDDSARRPGMLRNPTLRGGLTSFFFQYLLQAGLFFCVPLFLSVALGLSAIATGVRLLPLSLTLLLAAVGVPRLFPTASPRLVVRVGFLALLAGIVVMVGALDAGAGAEIVTWPMLLAGLGIGALASQLGAVTVSSVPDEQTGEVGGLQNTLTNLGASIGTALAGAVLIAALTSSFLSGIQSNPAIPADVKSKAQTELASGIPFVSDKDLQAALDKAGVPKDQADAIVAENSNARLAALRSSLTVLALLALLAVFLTFRIPTVQPGAKPDP